MKSRVAALFAASSGTVRYADGDLSGNCLNGNYSIANRNCTGFDGNAYGGALGVQNASHASSPGDTVLIRSFSGEYVGDGSGADTQPKFLKFNLKRGTNMSNRITYQGYPGDSRPVLGRGFADDEGGLRYVILKDLTVDGGNDAPPGNGSDSGGLSGGHNLSIENVSWGNFSGTGMGTVIDTELINFDLHSNGIRSHNAGTSAIDCGDGTGGDCHGIYSHGPGMVWDGGRIYNNAPSGIGINCYPKCNNNTFRNLRIENNRGAGMLCFNGSGNRWINIVTFNNPGGDAGFLCSGEFYNSTTTGELLLSGNATVRNVIALGGIHGRLGDGSLLDPMKLSGITISHSICPVGAYNGSSNYCTPGDIGGRNPSSHFVDAAAGDFRLVAGSPAINTGVDLSSEGFTTDLDGNTRDSGVWDIGAFEYGGTSGPTATPTPVPTTYTCSGGILCDGSPVTGSPNQQVCGADLMLWTCTNSGWRQAQSSCACAGPTPTPVSNDSTPPSLTILSPANSALVKRLSLD